MSSSKRPGTVDYSKWDNFECSDDDSEGKNSSNEDDNVRTNFLTSRHDFGGVNSDDDDEEEEYYDDESGSEEDDNEDDVLSPPPPSLAALQRAWNTDVSSITRPCSNCFTPNAPYRCSRCQLVRYCDTFCQRVYHPIHKLECIDAGHHRKYWGIFGDRKDDDVKGDFTVLRARRSSKRHRALQRAAAAAAVERAMRARMAQGGAADKGGEGKGKGADEREEECSICQSEFTVRGDGGVAFCCPTSHYMCNECSGVWVNSVMSTLDSSFPPKCPTCKALISQDLFVRQLTSSQQNNFRAHVARTALKEGEELFECKGCGLFEVVSDDPVLWWCPHCNLGSCRVCSEDLQMNADASPHNKCVELREPKRLIEQAIEEGSNMRCPGCQLAGRKDDACTHMTCTKCSTVWCYVCGLDVESCDKELRPGRMNDIYAHNADWAVNEKRCPMYLTQILEVDLHWLGENWEENATNEDFEDDEKCLDYLHRFKTIKLLQEVLKKVGEKAFISTFVEFDSIKNCGYTYTEVVSTCTDQLIDRREYLASRGLGEAEEDGSSDGGISFHEDDEAIDATTIDDENAPLIDTDAAALEEQRLIDDALHRSVETLVEDEQLRQALARSVEESGL